MSWEQRSKAYKVVVAPVVHIPWIISRRSSLRAGGRGSTLDERLKVDLLRLTAEVERVVAVRDVHRRRLLLHLANFPKMLRVLALYSRTKRLNHRHEARELIRVQY